MMDFSKFKNRQWYLLFGICSFLVGGVVVYGVITMRETPSKHSKGLKSSFTTGASRINRQEAWVHEFKNESDITKKRLDTIDSMLSKLLKFNEAPKDSNPSSAKETSQPLTLDSAVDPTQAFKDLRQNMLVAQSESQQTAQPQPNTQPIIAQVLPSIPGAPSPQATSHSQESLLPVTETLQVNPASSAAEALPGSTPFRSKGLKRVSLSLKNARSADALKTPDNMIPAGSFARAVLLGGVDASTSIQAASDPRPALLRITDAGTLPRKFRSDLQGCHALAACYGDLSSERVYMRLEKLTCTERQTGEILEVKVQGYISGEDGRTGVRGSVVDRSGETMRAAMFGGFLGGVGEFFSQSRNPITFSPVAGLAQTNPLGVGDMLKHGAGNGVSNALSQYANFYIKRSEQLQPVIQVAAGRDVTVVFTESSSLADSAYRQILGRVNDQERYQQIQAVGEENPPKPLNAWTTHSQRMNERGSRHE